MQSAQIMTAVTRNLAKAISRGYGIASLG
jgi:hypothetical protein